MCSGSGLIGDFRFEDDPGARFIQDSAAVSEVVRRWEGFVVSQMPKCEAPGAPSFSG